MMMTSKNKLTQTKTKNQTETRNLFYSYIIGLLAILIFIAPLVHVNFSKKNDEVTAYEKKLSKESLLISDELERFNLKSSEDPVIASFLSEQNEIVNKLESVKSANKKKLSQFKEEKRVFGWLTVRSFLVGFGVRIPYLLFAIIISFIVYKSKPETKLLKRSYTFLQVSTYSISFYHLVWCFWYSQDYPLSSYKYLAITLCVLFSIGVVYYIQHRRVFALKSNELLRSKIKDLVSFIFKHTPLSKDNEKWDLLKRVSNGE